MKRTLLGITLGLALGLSAPVLAEAPGSPNADPHHCGALVTLTLKQYDRVQVASNGLYRKPNGIFRAGLLLTKVNDSWPEFWQLAQECSPQH